MPRYTYLIIGGGMTADAAVRGIREVDSTGSIGLVSAEPEAPYNRPPLTKGLWKDQTLDSIWRDTGSQGVDLHLGRWIEAIDLWRRQATDDQGTDYTFEKLLFATGGRPRRLPFGAREILYYRTVADYHRLRELTRNGQRFAVIGGGFIGSEIAAALALNGKSVVMLFPGSGIGHRMFPPELSGFLTDFYRQKGVEVLPGESATGL
ncbi:MAG TPA: FAD/NAD(P)-binding oxidoreductase, partial [Candidatus Sulfotelmatobacter sp.]|nr:FAD/NAD(P)-binding oxidoreductase [Candidatus Sulfotelmatobacter sp.]